LQSEINVTHIVIPLYFMHRTHHYISLWVLRTLSQIIQKLNFLQWYIWNCYWGGQGISSTSPFCGAVSVVFFILKAWNAWNGDILSSVDDVISLDLCRMEFSALGCKHFSVITLNHCLFAHLHYGIDHLWVVLLYATLWSESSLSQNDYAVVSVIWTQSHFLSQIYTCF